MSENNTTQMTSISKATTIEEIAEFWDTHSLADYWDQTHEVEFEVSAERRRRVTLEPEIYRRLETQARRRGLTTTNSCKKNLEDTRFRMNAPLCYFYL